MEENVFEYAIYAKATLHVPEESIETYRTTAPWNYFSRWGIMMYDEVDGVCYKV